MVNYMPNYAQDSILVAIFLGRLAEQMRMAERPAQMNCTHTKYKIREEKKNKSSANKLKNDDLGIIFESFFVCLICKTSSKLIKPCFSHYFICVSICRICVCIFHVLAFGFIIRNEKCVEIKNNANKCLWTEAARVEDHCYIFLYFFILIFWKILGIRFTSEWYCNGRCSTS